MKTVLLIRLRPVFGRSHLIGRDEIELEQGRLTEAVRIGNRVIQIIERQAFFSLLYYRQSISEATFRITVWFYIGSPLRSNQKCYRDVVLVKLCG